MRTTFIEALIEEAEKNKDIVLLTGDLGFSVFESFKEKFPDRYFNMGVAEQNMIGVAAGLALRGKKVFVYSIIPFVTFRCLEQVRNDLCYPDLGVVIVGFGSGVAYGESGFSHHSMDDIGALKSTPGITILAPSNISETRSLVRKCLNYSHPVYLRLGKSNEINDKAAGKSDELSIGDVNFIKKGSELALIAHGSIMSEVLTAYEKLCKKGFSPSVISVPTIKPLNKKIFKDIFSEHKYIAVIEEHNSLGGLGSSIFSINKNNDSQNKFLHIAMPDKFIEDIGSSGYLRKRMGLDSDSIFKKIVAFTGK